jgi:hypothetical protein
MGAGQSVKGNKAKGIVKPSWVTNSKCYAAALAAKLIRLQESMHMQ